MKFIKPKNSAGNDHAPILTAWDIRTCTPIIGGKEFEFVKDQFARPLVQLARNNMFGFVSPIPIFFSVKDGTAAFGDLLPYVSGRYTYNLPITEELAKCTEDENKADAMSEILNDYLNEDFLTTCSCIKTTEDGKPYVNFWVTGILPKFIVKIQFNRNDDEESGYYIPMYSGNGRYDLFRFRRSDIGHCPFFIMDQYPTVSKSTRTYNCHDIRNVGGSILAELFNVDKMKIGLPTSLENAKNMMIFMSTGSIFPMGRIKSIILYEIKYQDDDLFDPGKVDPHYIALYDHLEDIAIKHLYTTKLSNTRVGSDEEYDGSLEYNREIIWEKDPIGMPKTHLVKDSIIPTYSIVVDDKPGE